MIVFQKKSFFLGAALAFIPGVLWGLSGVFGQHLFQAYDINAEWLVTGVSDEQTYFNLEYEFVRYERVK